MKIGFDFDNTIIDYVVDTTPSKQNKYHPKSNIKILLYFIKINGV